MFVRFSLIAAEITTLALCVWSICDSRGFPQRLGFVLMVLLIYLPLSSCLLLRWEQPLAISGFIVFSIVVMLGLLFPAL